MTPLIDGDIIIYTMAWVLETFTNESEIQKRINNYVLKLLKKTKCDGEFIIYVNGTGNYRYDIYPDYKANRSDNKKPIWFEYIKQHLISKWGAVEVKNIETDDALAITQIHYNAIDKPSIIVSKDKDLLQVPGNHYVMPNKSKDPGEFKIITPEEGFYRLMIQSLTGDSVDNIPGIYKVGPVKAEKILKDVHPYMYFDACIRAYEDRYNDDGCKLFWLNYRLVKLLTEEAYDFEIPEPSKIDTNLFKVIK